MPRTEIKLDRESRCPEWIARLNRMFDELASVGIHNSEDLRKRFEQINQERAVEQRRDVGTKP